MKCISDTYNIYLTDDNTLLFYDTFKNGELDKPNVVIKGAWEPFILLAEKMSEKTQQEIFDIACEWTEKNGSVPDVVKAMLYHMIFDIELEGGDEK